MLVQNQAAYSVQSDLDFKVIESGFSSSSVNISYAEWLYVVNGQSGYIASLRKAVHLENVQVITLTQLCPSQLHLPNIKRPTAEYYFSIKLD